MAKSRAWRFLSAAIAQRLKAGPTAAGFFLPAAEVAYLDALVERDLSTLAHG